VWKRHLSSRSREAVRVPGSPYVSLPLHLRGFKLKPVSSPAAKYYVFSDVLEQNAVLSLLALDSYRDPTYTDRLEAYVKNRQRLVENEAVVGEWVQDRANNLQGFGNT
jgi:hypothetical protein